MSADNIPGSSPTVTIDSPVVRTVGSSLLVSGWAIDTAAVSSAGIDSVSISIWAADASGNIKTPPKGLQPPPLFSGAASYGSARPDIAGIYGGQFLASGFSLQLPDQPTGTYLLVAYAHSSLADNWATTRQVLQIQDLVSNVLITLDSPASGVSPASFTVAGWAIDKTASSDSGVDAVYVYVWSSDASGNVAGGAQAGNQIYLAQAAIGVGRPDVAAQYGGQFGASGFILQVPGLPDGFYVIGVAGHSSLNGAWSLQTQVIQIGAPQTSIIPSGGKGIVKP